MVPEVRRQEWSAGTAICFSPSPKSTPDSTAASVFNEPVPSEQHTSVNKLFLETCQRAAQRLRVEWPQPPLPRASNRLDGNFLSPLMTAHKPSVPLFQDCLDDVVIARFGSLTEMEGVTERGVSDCPKVEQSLASYLAPDSKMGLSASSQLPHKQP